MKLSAPAQCTLYRAFTPRWAAEPLSGAGAARSGGRFNRFGQPALYLSLHLDTAAAEYAQAAPFLPPFTLVSYRADLPALADVRLLDAAGMRCGPTGPMTGARRWSTRSNRSAGCLATCCARRRFPG